MSCWREQHVLRMPATTIGIYTKEEWEEFYSKLCKKTDWSAGSFAPALCSYKNGPMIDYILVDSAPCGTTRKWSIFRFFKRIFPALLSNRWMTYTIVNTNGMTPQKRHTVTEIGYGCKDFQRR